MKAGEICEKAAYLVAGDRQQDYGDKNKNFQNIANLWNAYFANKPDWNAPPLTSVDVGHMMVLMKLARTQLGSVKADTYIDMAGYSGCSGEIALKDEAPKKP